MKLLKRKSGFCADRSGTTAVEFAIVGPMVFALMFWFFDISFSVYVQNTFTHAVNETAREIYIDPDRTDEQIIDELNTLLSRFGDGITATSSTETVGSLDYHVIKASMLYHFKCPPFSGASIRLKAQGRAPIVDYQLDSGSVDAAL